ncbi:MAG: HI0074 family nucleotidyltransferase substrate-binding subunit [Bacteroidota bacterium]|nr:HI0074 family nucleotidyltransferase substrate-binding subunit [Bacteroidota bacterium]MDE2645800.1 HI0074 family nucleotidyltransferase substrate-binding subunit [Bacteroidota bacterium]MXW33235.1 nucleotidyltransferase [Rhodothermaceae bacterium]MYE63349.1 nucleotidyltransferase [Rhodothermaceae bacterium]MYJ21198.1 nucleotidyltransferase [Rhodothermaceae bacterium]
MPLQLDSLKKSLHALTEVFAASENEERMSQFSYFERIAIRAGVLKHFEITYELCWKLIARWLNKNISSGIADGITRRHLFRLAAENQLIQDVDKWMQYHEGRNITTHVYDSDKAELIYKYIGDFVHHARDLLCALEARND